MTGVRGQAIRNSPTIRKTPGMRRRISTPIKSVLARIARGTPLRTLLTRAGAPVLVPLYHALADGAPPYLRHLYPVRAPEQFAGDLDWLLDHFRPIGPAELLAAATGTRALTEPSFLVTFDDGFRSFATEAAPLLAERGLTAVCFLNPAFVDNRDLMHRCKASLLIDHLERDPGAARRPEIQHWRRPEASGPLRNELLSIRYPQRERLERLAEILGLHWVDWLADHRPYLSREEISDLTRRGFYFGAHSLDHPEYELIPPAERRRQTQESMDWVVAHCRPELRLFALPFTDSGLPQRFFDQCYAAGIDLTFGTAGLKRDTSPRHCQRVPFETPEADAATLVKTELLYYLLKAPLGRNQIHRQ